LQSDFLWQQLHEVTERFNGHTLTKMSKQLKQEKNSLEKKLIELVIRSLLFSDGADPTEGGGC